MYKLFANGVMRLSDGAYIPAEVKNADWQEYQRWLDAGNTPLPERTLAETKEKHRAVITQARDTALRNLTADYDGDRWDADEDTSARIANALTMVREAAAIGITPPAAIPWRTADNRDRVLSIDELRALGAAVFLAQQEVWLKQANLKNQIEQASNETAAKAVRW